jgi:hypothetical protein
MSYTALEVQQLTKFKEDCINFGQECQRNNIKYNIENYSEVEKLYFEFGRFCAYYDIESDDFFNYEKFLNCGAYNWHKDDINFMSIEENLVYVFLRRLKTGEYKCILMDGQASILADEFYSLYEYVREELINSELKLGCDRIKIISNKRDLLLEGIENISQAEIKARKFLSKCEDNVIVRKDTINDISENNFKEIDGFYELTKDVVKVEDIDNEDDCIRVTYENNKNEIWQIG